MDDCCFISFVGDQLNSPTPSLVWKILLDWAADWFIENKMINVGLFFKRLPAALHHNRLLPVHMLVLISLKDKSECFVLVFFFFLIPTKALISTWRLVPTLAIRAVGCWKEATGYPSTVQRDYQEQLISQLHGLWPQTDRFQTSVCKTLWNFMVCCIHWSLNVICSQALTYITFLKY